MANANPPFPLAAPHAVDGASACPSYRVPPNQGTGSPMSPLKAERNGIWPPTA